MKKPNNATYLQEVIKKTAIVECFLIIYGFYYMINRRFLVFLFHCIFLSFLSLKKIIYKLISIIIAFA